MTSSGLQLRVNRNTSVLADEMGRVLDPFPPTNEAYKYKSSTRPRTTAACRHAAVAPRHGQDVVVDPAGNAFSVRLHLAQHLHHEQRVVKLESTVSDLEEQVDAHQRLIHDLRREKFVTQGAFMAAQLCKADQGALQSLRRKLDLVCELLISAGLLEETASGGLGIRETEEGSESHAAVQEVGAENGNMAFLEEGLAYVEESIERVEKEAKTAREEAQRAAAEAANASARSEKVVTQCRRVDERCAKVEELSRQAEARSTMAIQECRRRVDQGLEDSGERVETNSTRIFHLAAEVEGFVKEIRRPSAATGPSAVIRVETRQIFPVEVADLPPQQQRSGRTTEASAYEAPHRQEDENCVSVKAGTTNDALEEMRELSTLAEVQKERAPGHPGVLSQDLTQEEARARSSFLAERLQQAVSPPGWRRRHSTYISRRAAASSRSKARLVASPVRPQEDPLTTGRTLWSRASSWPSLANEISVAHRDKLKKDADANVEDGILGRRDHPTPDLEISPRPSEQSETTAVDACNGQDMSASIFYCNDDPAEARNIEKQPDVGHAHQSESSSKVHQSAQVDSTGEGPRSSAPLTSLARMTAKEVAEALSTTPVGKRSSSATLDTAFDDLPVRSSSPGSQLANLGDTPTLHSHGDTWGAISSSSDGSSVSLVGGREGQPNAD